LQYWDMIPEGIDILLCHCPPYGIMDFVTRKYEKHSISIGSQSLRNRIEKIRPKYVVFGHAHSNHGTETIDGITYINCCLLSESYTMIYKPTYLNFKDD
jgi:Icc-related predicted phosphoesterase